MNPTEKGMRVRAERLLDSALDTLDAVPAILVPSVDLVREKAKLEARAALVGDELARRAAERLGPEARGWSEAPPFERFAAGGLAAQTAVDQAVAAALPQGQRTPRRRKGRR